jgi:ribosomal protein L7/L12
MAELESDLEALRSENVEMLQKVNEVDAEKHLLAEQMTGFTIEKQQEMEQQAVEIEDLKASLENLAEENRTLKRELSSSFGEEELEQIRQEREELRSQLEKYQLFCNELESKVGQYRKADTVVDFTVPEEDPEKEALIQEKENLEQEREELTQKADEYQRLFEELQGKVGEYRATDTVDDNSAEHKDHIIETLTIERDELTEKIREYKDKISSLEFDAEELEILKEDNHRLKIYIEENLKQEQEESPKRDEGTDALREEVAKIDGSLQGLTDENKLLYEELLHLISIIEEKNRNFGQIESLTSVLTGRPQSAAEDDGPPHPRTPITTAEGAVLSNDDLLAEIEEPGIPKVTHTTNILRRKLYNVFLPKLSTDEKKENAIPVLEEILRISADEAGELVQKVVIPVVKGVPEDEANAIKKRFLQVGILARVKSQV